MDGGEMDVPDRHKAGPGRVQGGVAERPDRA
jgi:hypothetical protein